MGTTAELLTERVLCSETPNRNRCLPHRQEGFRVWRLAKDAIAGYAPSVSGCPIARTTGIAGSAGQHHVNVNHERGESESLPRLGPRYAFDGS